MLDGGGTQEQERHPLLYGEPHSEEVRLPRGVNPGFRGKITFDDCPHGGDGEDEYYFIMNGSNEDATDSVERYILCIPDLDLM